MTLNKPFPTGRRTSFVSENEENHLESFISYLKHINTMY